MLILPWRDFETQSVLPAYAAKRGVACNLAITEAPAFNVLALVACLSLHLQARLNLPLLLMTLVPDSAATGDHIRQSVPDIIRGFVCVRGCHAGLRFHVER